MKRSAALLLVAIIALFALFAPTARTSAMTCPDGMIPNPNYPVTDSENPCIPDDPTPPIEPPIVPPTCLPTEILVDLGGGIYECQPIVPPVIPPVIPPVDPCVTSSSNLQTRGDAPSCPTPPTPTEVPVTPVVEPAPGRDDGGISFNDSDLGVVLYTAPDETGKSALEVYDMRNNGVNGNYQFSITQDDLAPFAGNLPTENTLLRAGGHVAVYMLTTGEIQINVGPDSEGKIHVKIFDGIPWTHVYGYTIDPVK